MSKVEHSKESLALADAFLKTYDPKSTDDIQSAFKDMLGPVFEAMLKGELTNHLRFENNNHQEKTQRWLFYTCYYSQKNIEHIGHRIQNNFNVC